MNMQNSLVWSRLRQSRQPYSVTDLDNATDKSPTATEFAEGKHQFVGALLQWQVHSIIRRVHNAKEREISKVLRAPAAIKNLAIEG